MNKPRRPWFGQETADQRQHRVQWVADGLTAQAYGPGVWDSVVMLFSSAYRIGGADLRFCNDVRSLMRDRPA